jgi:hypothetical protein
MTVSNVVTDAADIAAMDVEIDASSGGPAAGGSRSSSHDNIALPVNITTSETTQTMTTATRRRTLPIMSSSSSGNGGSGGVVFFLHIPKTGGTTIRKNLETIDGIQYIFAKNYSTYYESAPLVEEAILGSQRRSRSNNMNRSTVLFYEIHATTAPSFFRLRQRLKRWRDTASRNQVPVFFFTLIREPISFAFSHFRFFHVEKRNPTFERCNATEDNFLRLSLENPQCQFLYKGEPSMRAQKAVLNGTVIQPHECRQVQQHVLELFDWVGVTENLSNETIPLLANVLDLNQTVVDQWTSYKISNIGFGARNVTARTIETIHRMSTLDKELYDVVAKKHFPYSQFFPQNRHENINTVDQR